MTKTAATDVNSLLEQSIDFNIYLSFHISLKLQDPEIK